MNLQTNQFVINLSTPAVPNCCCSYGPELYWSNPPFLISDIRALWRSGLSARAPECQKIYTQQIYFLQRLQRECLHLPKVIIITILNFKKYPLKLGIDALTTCEQVYLLTIL